MKLDERLSAARAAAVRSVSRVTRPSSPFDRLLRTQVLMLAGDALVAIALAGSLFFNISPHAARDHVLLGLGLTFVPFVVIAPVIGPLLDAIRGMRKAMVLASALGRVALCLMLAGDLKSFLLFPESFGLLVLSKVYGVSKQALVPEVSQEDTYVHANATLNFFGAVAGFVGSGIGIAVWKIPGLGSPWVLRVDALVFLVAVVSAWGLPRSKGTRGERVPSTVEVPTDPFGTPPVPQEQPDFPHARATAAEHEDLVDIPVTHRALRNRIVKQRMAGLFAAASAMAVLRASTGFLEFLLIFTLRREHYGLIWFGIVLSGLTIGSVIANVFAPAIRSHLAEERIIVGALAVVCLVSAATGSSGGMLTEALLMASVTFATGVAKVAFDAMVQRDTPEARRGTAFARFETRFQLVWVAGAVIPVAVAFPVTWGDGAMAAAAALAAAAYWVRGRAVCPSAPAGRPPVGR